MKTPRQKFWEGSAKKAAAEGNDVAAGLFALIAQPSETEIRDQAESKLLDEKDPSTWPSPDEETEFIKTQAKDLARQLNDVRTVLVYGTQGHDADCSCTGCVAKRML